MSEKKPYVVSLCQDEVCVKKRLKLESPATFELVSVVAVGLRVNGELRLVLPITTIDLEDFKNLATKYGVDLEGVVGYATEIKEEKKGERVIKFETEQ